MASGTISKLANESSCSLATLQTTRSGSVRPDEPAGVHNRET